MQDYNEIQLIAPINGACKGTPNEIWFPAQVPGGVSKEARQKMKDDERMAKEICGRCDQTKQCLEYSLVYEPFGVWGGMNEVERAIMRTERDAQQSAARARI